MANSMVGNAIFLIVMWSVAIFLANRLYVIIRYRALNVKGITYSRRNTPVMYWIEMAILVFGFLMVAGIAVIVTLGSLGLIN